MRSQPRTEQRRSWPPPLLGHPPLSRKCAGSRFLRRQRCRSSSGTSVFVVRPRLLYFGYSVPETGKTAVGGVDQDQSVAVDGSEVRCISRTTTTRHVPGVGVGETGMFWARHDNFVGTSDQVFETPTFLPAIHRRLNNVAPGPRLHQRLCFQPTPADDSG